MNHLKPHAHSELECKVEDEVARADMHEAVSQVSPPHCGYAVPGDVMNEASILS